jgi:hypothetical protein
VDREIASTTTVKFDRVRYRADISTAVEWFGLQQLHGTRDVPVVRTLQTQHWVCDIACAPVMLGLKQCPGVSTSVVHD